MYCGVQGICGAIVTQQGGISLVEDPEGGGGDEGDDIAREGVYGFEIKEVNEDDRALVAMGRPIAVQSPEAFLGWLKSVQDYNGPAVTAQQATAIAREASRLRS